MVAWERRGDLPGQMCLSVNLAARQLLANDLCSVIEEVLRTSGLEASHLCLEITEGVLLEDTEATLRALHELKALGVRIAVDDFGTGFSALSYLKRLPVDVLKIDRSFVVGLGRDREDRALVASVVDLAHAFGLTTVAEGVETPEQLTELRALGCELAQGYLWSRAMPADAAAEWMAAQAVASSASSPSLAAPVAVADPFDEGRARARVLLVDDDASVRRVLRMLLDDEDGFEVVGEAEDGESAIATVHALRPDVLLLDVQLPDMDGFAVCRALDMNGSTPAVVLVSSRDAADYGGLIQQSGARGFIPKGELCGGALSDVLA
jgi:EAL domain-containing protein (putative c-di-GMP-specific phosphodiesterase class I)/CheY-like chemotaxis protein